MGCVCRIMKVRKRKGLQKHFLRFCYDREHYREILQTMYAIPVTKDAVLYAAPMVQQGVFNGLSLCRKKY